MVSNEQDKGMTPAPLALFAYNRPTHTERVVASLLKNRLASETELFVYSDGPRRPEDAPLVDRVRKILHSITGFKSVQIIEQGRNLGLANSVISGVSEVVQRYGKVIVVEDDLLLSPNFLTFMNTVLDFYSPFEKVYSVTGFSYPAGAIHIPKDYSYDVYLSYRCMSWGWATWIDRWQTVDWKVTSFEPFLRDRKSQKLFNQGGEDLSDMLKLQMIGKIDSWAIRWCYAHFQNQAFCLYPVRSLVSNLGFDRSGTHCGVARRGLPRPELDDHWTAERLLDEISTNRQIVDSFRKIHKKSIFSRAKTKLNLFLSMGVL